MKSQNAVIACECRAMPLPRTLFKRLFPMTTLVAITAGENTPNLDCFAIVHLGPACDDGRFGVNEVDPC